MLGKLLKHDFKSTGKVLIPVHLVLVIITIIGSVLLGTNLLQRVEMLPMSMGLLIMYILMLFALALVTGIYLIIHYYRSMFSAQGYLTFTLPASPWLIFNSKVIVGCVWFLINLTLTVISVLVLIASAGGFANLAALVEEVFVSGITIATESVSISLLELMGYTPVQFVVLFILLLVMDCFFGTAVSYGSITIGQLYAKHKVVGAVLTYIIIYFIIQVVMTTAMFVCSFSNILGTITATSETMTDTAMIELMQSIYQPMIPMTIIVYLVVGVICYTASVIIIKKKVNLD